MNIKNIKDIFKSIGIGVAVILWFYINRDSW